MKIFFPFSVKIAHVGNTGLSLRRLNLSDAYFNLEFFFLICMDEGSHKVDIGVIRFQQTESMCIYVLMGHVAVQRFSRSMASSSLYTLVSYS